MKKFLLALLVPFLMVMSVSALSIEESETSYGGDDIIMELYNGENGGFRLVLSNASGDDCVIDPSDSYYAPVSNDGEPLADPEPIFTEAEVDAGNFVVPAGNYWGTEEFTFLNGLQYVFFHFTIYIDDAPTTWDVIVNAK